MTERAFTATEMLAMSKRIERAGQPNADTSEYHDTSAMLRQAAAAEYLKADVQAIVDRNKNSAHWCGRCADVAARLEGMRPHE